MSESAGRLSNVSGEEAATEASFERKGSLGLIGGMGILAVFLGFIEQKVLRFLLRGNCEEEDEVGIKVAIGTRKDAAIIAFGLIFKIDELLRILGFNL